MVAICKWRMRFGVQLIFKPFYLYIIYSNFFDFILTRMRVREYIPIFEKILDLI